MSFDRSEALMDLYLIDTFEQVRNVKAKIRQFNILLKFQA